MHGNGSFRQSVVSPVGRFALGCFAPGLFHPYMVGRFALFLLKPQDLIQDMFGHMDDYLDFPSIILVECRCVLVVVVVVGHMLIHTGEKLPHKEYVNRSHIQRSEDISRHIKFFRK